MSSKNCLQCGTSLPADSVAGICIACESVVDQTVIKKDDVTAIEPTIVPGVSGRDSNGGDTNVAETGPPKHSAQDTDISIDSEGFPPDTPIDGGSAERVDRDDSSSGPPDTRQFGDYEIEGEIARGGMGVVFRARQVSLNRPVALKMILSAQLASDDDVQRFYIEAESAAKLEHPGIVPIYEVGEHDGQHFFSMGLVEGGSLSDLVQDGPLPPRKAAELLRAIAEAVQYAHARNIVHRDLKPANVLLDKHGQPKITDFGLAKNVEQDSGLTATGQVMGTPGYMPPEQASGKMDEVGPLADVYSLGAVLFCLLTGRPPFQGNSLVETLRLVVEQEAISPRQHNDKVDLDLATICLKCLEKDAGSRYGSAGELADELGRYLQHEPIVARPLGRAARIGRWSRRNPLVATLSALSVTFLVGGAVVATYFAVVAGNRANQLGRSNTALTAKQEELSRANEQLGTALGEAKNERTNAQQARDREESLKEEKRLQLYVADMNLAQQAFDVSNLDRMNELLEKYRPRPGTLDKDLRGFEWYHWWQAGHLHEYRFDAGPSPIRRLVGSPDGKLVVLQQDGGLNFFGDRPVLVDKPGELRFSPNGTTLAVGNDSGEIFLYSMSNGMLAKRLNGGHQAQDKWEEGYTFSGVSVAFSPTEPLLASGDQTGKIVLWDIITAQPIGTMQFTEQLGARIRSVAFSPDGKLLVAGMENHKVVVWDVAGREFNRILTEHDELVNCVTFSSRGLLASGSYDGTIRLWDKELESSIRLVAHGPVQSLTFSPNGKLLGAGTSSNTVLVWRVEPAPAKLIHTIKAHSRRVHGVAFTADSHTIRSAGEDGHYKKWDLARCEPYVTLQGHGETVVAYAPDGRALFVDHEGILQSYNLKTRLKTSHLGNTLGNPLSNKERYGFSQITTSSRKPASIITSGIRLSTTPCSPKQKPSFKEWNPSLARSTDIDAV